MKNILATFFILLSLPSVAQFKQTDFEKLFGLTGTWQMPAKKGGFLYEQWEKKNDQLMLSKSYKVTGQDTVALERVELSFHRGEIFYTPTVPDQNQGKPVPFKLMKVEGNVFYFENKAHDFPQRIIYTLKSNTELECVTDGETSKGYVKQAFPFTRVK